MMTNADRRDAQMAYVSDDGIMEEQKVCRRKLQKLNFMDRSDFEGIREVVRDLLGKSEGAFINPPFYCDYGTHIEAGKNFYANYNCTILDVAKVTIGAGSVVTRDIPDWSVAAGNPCRVIRRITDKDMRKLFGQEEIDQEAWDAIVKMTENREETP